MGDDNHKNNGNTSDIKEKLITIKRIQSNGDDCMTTPIAMDMLLNVDATLSIIRIKLRDENFMKSNDCFIWRNCVTQNQEDRIQLQQILSENNELRIGDAVSSSSSSPSSTSTSSSIIPHPPVNEGVNCEHQLLLSSIEKRAIYLRDVVQMCGGYNIQSNGELIKMNVSGNQAIFEFTSNYAATALLPDVTIMERKFTAISEMEHIMQKSGADSTKISLSAPFVSAEAHFATKNSQQQTRAHTITYFTSKILFRKLMIVIDPRRLKVTRSFARRMDGTDGDDNDNQDTFTLDACKHVVNTLNRFGWYMPLEYTLGGAVYSTKTEIVNSLEDMHEKSTEFDGSVNASFRNYGGGIGHTSSPGSTEANKRNDAHSVVRLDQIGGDGTSAEADATAYLRSLNYPRHWRVIELGNFYPTLAVLENFSTQLMARCVGLLRTYGEMNEIRRLQSTINIKDYAKVVSATMPPTTLGG